jgi:CRISPR-associated protein Cas5d
MPGANAVCLRIWGDYACFTRPEMNVERVSYPICTPSAARGILEAIFWEPQMYYIVDSVAVIKKGRWFSFRRNEVSSVVSVNDARSWMKGKTPVKYIEAGGGAPDAAQRNMLALADVEYVITAEIHLTKRAVRPRDNEAKYMNEFRVRATRGKCYHRPALGCREFAADFDWVEDRQSVAVGNWHEEDLGLMLYDVFDPALWAEASLDRPRVSPAALFFHAVIKDGVMDCHRDRVRLIRPKTKEGA